MSADMNGDGNIDFEEFMKHFSDAKVDSSAEVLENWEEIKRKEKSFKRIKKRN